MNKKAEQYKAFIKTTADTIATYGHRGVEGFRDAASLANDTLHIPFPNEAQLKLRAESIVRDIKAGLTVYVPGHQYFQASVAVEYASLSAKLNTINQPEAFLNPKKQIVKGSVVLYGEGHYRVSAVFKNTVNLAQVFGSKIVHKNVLLQFVQEDEAAWYEAWQNSESYRSM